MNAEKPRDTLVFGCGYLGMRVAKRLIFLGGRVWGVTRSQAKIAEFQNLGIRPIVADWTDPQTLDQLPTVEQILVAVSYDRRSGLDRHESQVGGLRNLLERTSDDVNVCYISTTGVYHQSDGGWVDESSPCLPQQVGGQVHLAAEQMLESMRPASPWTVLRLSGIYGPGRIPRVKDVLAGRPIASPQAGYLNLIHVDDAAEAVISSWSNSKESLYLVSDDRPVVRGEFYREIAKQFDAPEPVFVKPAEDASVTMRSSSNKRIRNDRMKQDLLLDLKYPTFREGVAAIGIDY